MPDPDIDQVDGTDAEIMAWRWPNATATLKIDLARALKFLLNSLYTAQLYLIFSILLSSVRAPLVSLCDGMSLQRGEIIGYDPERMLFRFSMAQGENAVLFEISNAALADLGKRWISRGAIDRDRVFEEHRDLIEAIASRLYSTRAADLIRPIMIFAKHLPEKY